MGESTKKIMRLLESSEMYCSLKYESAEGCPYNAFTPRSIAALSVASTLCAIVSLIAGMH